MDFFTIFFQWGIIFLINIIPAFAPPTWMVLSYFYITNPQNIFLLVFVGVTASTFGRYALAKLSGTIFKKFANEKKKKEIELLRKRLNKKPLAKFIFSFVFALGPLPSNALFIAAGSTKLNLKEIIAGFFVGRFLSYLFLIFTSQKIFTSFEQTLLGEATFITILIEILGIIAILTFFFIDWIKILDCVDNCLIKIKKNKIKRN